MAHAPQTNFVSASIADEAMHALAEEMCRFGRGGGTHCHWLLQHALQVTGSDARRPVCVQMVHSHVSDQAQEKTGR